MELFNHFLLKHNQTPENYFRESLEEQEGVPFPVQPYEELERKFKSVRDALQYQPERVDGEFFRMFHRQDGFFCLQRKGLDRMIDVGAVAIDETEGVIERLYDHVPEALTNNVYFTVNSYYRALGGARKPTFLPRSARKEFNIRWLNACYADIDVGRFGCEDEYWMRINCPELLPKDIMKEGEDPSSHLAWEQALLQVMILEEEGIIPWVSIYAKSGRGIYLFWLLEPVKYHSSQPWILQNFKNCNKALGSALRGKLPSSVLPADPMATDGARILRIHGSVHTSTKTRVCYFPSCLQEVEKIYTLPEIMGFVGVQDIQQEASSPEKKIFKAALKPHSVPKRSAGVIASMKYRMADAEKLFRAHRIPKGIRYSSLWNLSLFHFHAGIEEAETLRHLEELAGHCCPPYPTTGEDNDIPVKEIVASVYHNAHGLFLFNNAVLCKFWKIDRETAERLDLHVLRPVDAKRLPPASDKAKELNARREALLRLEPEKYSLRELLAMMGAAKYNLSKTTLRDDLTYLIKAGVIKRENQQGGRPKKRMV